MAGSAHGSRTMGDESQAVAELDQIIARRRSRAAASAVNRKVRMSEEHVALIMSMKRCDMPSDEDEEKLERLSRRHPDRYTPEVLEGMRREHKELVAMFRRDDEEHEAMQAEVMREMADKGYVETDEVDQTYVDEVNEWTRVQWEAMVSSSDKLSRMRLSDEENAELLQDFITRQAEEQQQHQEEDYYSDDDDYYTDEEEDDDDDDATLESSDDATAEASGAAIVEAFDRPGCRPTVISVTEAVICT